MTRRRWPVSCVRRGPGSIPASADQLDALHAAVAPVIDRLAADPNTADLLADIQALAAEHPDTDVPDVPDSCQQTMTADTTASTAGAEGSTNTAATVSEPEASVVSDASVPSDTFPEGVYHVQYPEGDVTETYIDSVSRGYLETRAARLRTHVRDRVRPDLDDELERCDAVVWKSA